MGDSDGSSGGERRRAERERAFIGAELRVPGEEEPRLAVVRDCSLTGIQLLTPRAVDVGVRIEAEVLGEDDAPIAVAGEVVRAEKLDTFDGPWRWQVAIELETRSPELVELATRFRARQEKLRRGT